MTKLSNNTETPNLLKPLLGDVLILKKECLHKFHSVYYNSEWEVECKKCDKNVRDLYNKEDAIIVVEKLINKIQI